MKYTIHTILLVVLTTLMVIPFTSCSSDAEDNKALLTPEPEPEPEIVDTRIEVEVGKFETGIDILNELRRKKVRLGIPIDDDLTDPNFPISGKQYTIKVSVVSMYKAGLDTVSTYQQVYNQYLEQGYRPLTPEEVFALRLEYLKEQPEMETGAMRGRFFILIDTKVTATYGWSDGYYVMSNFREYRIGKRQLDRPLDPETSGVEWYHPPTAMKIVRFAVVKKE